MPDQKSEEEWRVIPGWDEYSASSNGRRSGADMCEDCVGSCGIEAFR